ncbi:RimK family alpha-L-glutamate ligase [Streptomyces sp. NPDC090303]|uniref:ATP-grasp domain-containing protein n=1 Tax=Streptomyces sp. NPDC090303 TaxID=3365960 RepID=UPI00381EDA3F
MTPSSIPAPDRPRRRPRVACVTSRQYENLYEEDRPLLTAFAERGIDARAAVWDDPAVVWPEYDLVLLRSPWDYHARPEAFLDWYRTVSEQTVTVNSFKAVSGNQHKGYLRELHRRGAPVIPTAVILKPSAARATAAEHGWADPVLKPATSMGGRGVHRVAEVDTVALDATSTGDWVVQPLQRNVYDEGEISLVYLGGRLSHAVRKWPGPGEIRIQESHGGSHGPHPVDAELIAAGDEVIDAAGVRDELVVRIDLIRGDDGRLLLCELELTAPRLFFCHHPAATDALADAVSGRIELRDRHL